MRLPQQDSSYSGELIEKWYILHLTNHISRLTGRELDLNLNLNHFLEMLGWWLLCLDCSLSPTAVQFVLTLSSPQSSTQAGPGTTRNLSCSASQWASLIRVGSWLPPAWTIPCGPSAPPDGIPPRLLQLWTARVEDSRGMLCTSYWGLVARPSWSACAALGGSTLADRLARLTAVSCQLSADSSWQHSQWPDNCSSVRLIFKWCIRAVLNPM